MSPPDDPDSEDAAERDEVAGPPAGAVVGPVAVWAAALLLGAAVGTRLGTHAAAAVADASSSGTPLRAWLTAATVVAVAAIVLVTRRRPRRPSGTDLPVRPGVVLLVLAVGIVLAAARTATFDLGALPELARRGGEAQVTFTVAAEPRLIATGWHVPVRVTDVDGRPTRERAALSLLPEVVTAPPHDGRVPTLGSRWTAAATARPLPDGGYGRWLAGQHLTALLDPGRLTPAGTPGWFARTSEHVRAQTRRAATAGAGDRIGGLLVGLVTGDTRLLAEDDRAAMEATATTHLTAVSGMHLATVVAGTLGLCSLVRCGARSRRIAVAVVVCWFAYLTRFQPSVLRAGTMAGVVLLTASRGVLRDARSALAAAVLLLVLVDPLLASSVGLLMSASAVGGILVLAPRIRERLGRLPDRLADVLAVTAAAQVAVVPLLLTTFGEVPLASVPANLVAVPLGVATAVVAFPATVVAAVAPTAGAVLFAVAGVPARGILAAAEATAGLGGAAAVAAPITVVAFVAVSLWAVATPRTRTARAVGIGAAVACLLAAVPPVVGRVIPPTGFTVTAIDVGQGDAFLLRTPGARVLVDTGTDDTAARWLARHGQVGLDLVVLTHGHLDHVGGAVAVLDRAEVAAVWRPPTPTPVDAIERFDAAATARDVPVRVVTAPAATRIGDLHLEVLNPPSGRPYRHASSELNDGSLVIRATWGDRAALLSGDVETDAQRTLLADAAARVVAGAPDPLAVGLLTVPHHGSATTDPRFLAHVGAPVGLISVGVDNDHGHPHAATVAALDAAGTRVVRTDESGTVTVEVPPTPVRGGGPADPDPTADAPRAPAGHRPSVASRHGSRPPHRRRRRPAAPTRARAGPRRPARTGPRTQRRRPRRLRDRPPPGAADRVAVRRPHVRGPPRDRAGVG